MKLRGLDEEGNDCGDAIRFAPCESRPLTRSGGRVRRVGRGEFSHAREGERGTGHVAEACTPSPFQAVGDRRFIGVGVDCRDPRDGSWQVVELFCQTARQLQEDRRGHTRTRTASFGELHRACENLDAARRPPLGDQPSAETREGFRFVGRIPESALEEPAGSSAQSRGLPGAARPQPHSVLRAPSLGLRLEMLHVRQRVLQSSELDPPGDPQPSAARRAGGPGERLIEPARSLLRVSHQAGRKLEGTCGDRRRRIGDPGAFEAGQGGVHVSNLCEEFARGRAEMRVACGYTRLPGLRQRRQGCLRAPRRARVDLEDATSDFAMPRRALEHFEVERSGLFLLSVEERVIPFAKNRRDFASADRVLRRSRSHRVPDAMKDPRIGVNRDRCPAHVVRRRNPRPGFGEEGLRERTRPPANEECRPLAARDPSENRARASDCNRRRGRRKARTTGMPHDEQ